MNDIEVLKQHSAEIKAKYGVRKIGVFGSIIRGTQNKESDIDILVDFDKPSFDNLMDLAFYLEELFNRKVDLVTTEGLSSSIKSDVEKEVAWCE